MGKSCSVDSCTYHHYAAGKCKKHYEEALAELKKCNVNVAAKKAKVDTEAARKEQRVTCGASIVIKNVLPFLALK